MPLDRPLSEYPSVITWGDGLRQQWGGNPLGEDPEKLASLEEFCRFVGESPDEMVAKCFRIRKSDGERVLSAKWRTHYAGKIKEFRLAAGAEGRRRGAAVLGFLIHNGILIQG